MFADDVEKGAVSQKKTWNEKLRDLERWLLTVDFFQKKSKKKYGPFPDSEFTTPSAPEPPPPGSWAEGRGLRGVGGVRKVEYDGTVQCSVDPLIVDQILCVHPEEQLRGGGEGELEPRWLR